MMMMMVLRSSKKLRACCSSSDWASLPEDLLALILHRLIQLSDYFRFGAVCKPWHAAADHQKVHRRRDKQEVPMLLIPPPAKTAEEADYHCRRLYSVTQRKVLPNLELRVPYPRRCCGSSHGWLATWNQADAGITLLNPFSGKSFRFPKFHSLMTDSSRIIASIFADNPIGKLPDHLLIEIFIRVPLSEWVQLSCVKKQWANLFREECLWNAALLRNFPFAGHAKRWPGPIPRGLSKRRYTALYISKHIFSLDTTLDENHEIVGHIYLFLKEQLEISIMPTPAGILHGTIIDQFIACGKTRDKAYELASQIWLSVIDNLEENEHTFLLLKRLALEEDVFLPYPYTRSQKVQWRVFEKLFTDFRDCFNHDDYYDVLACAKHKFQPIPSAWLGY